MAAMGTKQVSAHQPLNRRRFKIILHGNAVRTCRMMIVINWFGVMIGEKSIGMFLKLRDGPIPDIKPTHAFYTGELSP